MNNDDEKIERSWLLQFSLQVWPELESYVDRIIVYYVGPASTYWPAFDSSPEHMSDQVFIDSVNKQADEGKDILLLCNISEGMRVPIFDKVHRSLPKLKISHSRIYMTTAALDGIELYEEYCQTQGWNERVNILPANSFLKVSRELSCINPSEYTPRIRDKNFLCFNRVERKHRIILVAKLLLEDLLKNSFYSFYSNNFDNNWLIRIDDIPVQYRAILEKNADLFPMHLTGNQHTRNNPVDLVEEDRILYEESYYSVITETIFYKEAERIAAGCISSIFFTEKTYKPIAMKHPFILVSMPNSLKWLKSMGFKTFHPFINESYDDEHDDDLRLQMIVDEIKRLDSFTDQEWMQWQIGIKDIVEHNFKVYNSITISSLGQPILNLPQ